MKLLNTQPDHFLCHYTFVVDTYGDKCSFDCRYCYAKVSNQTDLDVNYVDRLLNESLIQNKRSGLREIFSKKIPLRIGYERDPFQKNETEQKVTKSLLKILNKYNYPYIIITKADTLIQSDYLDLLKNGNCYIQISLSALDSTILRSEEPNAPSADQRIKVLNTLFDNEVDCALRLNVFPSDLLLKYNKSLEEYQDELNDILTQTKVKKIIVNPIRIKGIELIDDKLYFNMLREIAERENKEISYCYLGGALQQKELMDAGNCCQCNIGKSDMLNPLSLISHYRIYSPLNFLPKYFISVFYRLIRKLIKDAKK